MVTRKIIGIDLAGNPKNRTGFALLVEEFGQRDIKSKTLFSDEEIIEEIQKTHPDLVAIDAPLTNKVQDRKCDQELKTYGTLPLLLPGMRLLAQRGCQLSQKIAQLNIPVIEISARATEKIMGIEANAFSRSSHQRDAILAAITGFLHLQGETREVGDRGGKIVIPKPPRKKPLKR